MKLLFDAQIQKTMNNHTVRQSRGTGSARKSHELRTSTVGRKYLPTSRTTSFMWKHFPAAVIPLTKLHVYQLITGSSCHCHVSLPSSSVSVAGWAPLDSIACPSVMRYQVSATPSLSLTLSLPSPLSLSLSPVSFTPSPPTPRSLQISLPSDEN